MTAAFIFDLVVGVGIPAGLFLMGLVVGTAVERAHLRRLDDREHALAALPVTDLRTPPAGYDGRGGMLVSGSAVIGSDYFKTLVASLRKIIGGEVRSFERMMQRARREATCRLLERSRDLGAVAVINVRYETSNIGRMTKKPMPMVEVVAYGTAVLPAPPSSDPEHVLAHAAG